MQCQICLSNDGEVVQKGCYCRGDAGAVHLECLIELATYTASSAADETCAWTMCGVCKGDFDGPVVRGLAAAWLARTEPRKSDSDDAHLEYQAARLLSANDLGMDAAAAEAIVREVLEARTRLLGEHDDRTLWAAHGLATSLYRQGKYSEAIDLLHTTIATMEIAQVSEPDLIATRATLAVVYCEAGRHEEALETQLAVCEATERTHDADDPKTLDYKGVLLSVYTNTGRIAPALELAQDLLARKTRVYGASNFSTLALEANTSILYMKLRRYAEAEDLARVALEKFRAAEGGSDSINTAIYTANVGLFTLLNGRPDEAEPILREAIDTARTAASFGPRFILFFSASHGLALTRLGKHAEAVAQLKETHQQQSDELGPEHSSTLRTACFLGEALVAQNAVEEGRAVLEETLAAQTRVLGAEAYETEETARRLNALDRPP